MRTILYTVSLLALSFAAHAFADETRFVSTCNESLKERMRGAANRQGTCEVTITNGVDSVTKTYRAKLVGDSASEAQLALQEFCETCGTEGPTQKYAVQWNDLTNHILENLAEQVKAPATPAATAAGDCKAKTTKEDVMSCFLATLNKATQPDEAALYYQTNIEPAMQRLAQSKAEEDRLLLRRTILTFYTGVQGAAQHSRTVAESVEQFNRFASYGETLARMARDAQTMPQNARGIEIARMNTLGQAEAYFRNRPMLLRQMNVNDPKLLKNAELLLATLKQGGDASPASMGTDINGRPRQQYGMPGGMVNNGIAPRQMNGAGSPFHKD